jgi:bacterioferritin-associated ferredoxin
VIVCHCEVVNDQAVTCAIDSGARTLAQVCAATGAGRNCGTCVFTLKRILCQHEVAVSTAPITKAAPIMEVERAAG